MKRTELRELLDGLQRIRCLVEGKKFYKGVYDPASYDKEIEERMPRLVQLAEKTAAEYNDAIGTDALYFLNTRLFNLHYEIWWLDTSRIAYHDEELED